LHLNGIVAGFIDLLLAEWTDHRTDLSGDGVYSANSGAGSEFPCVTSQFYSKDRCQRTHCRWNLAYEAPSITKHHSRRSLCMKPQHPCHQKAKVSALALTMSKAPKRPSQRDELRQQDDEAGAQQPKSSARKPRAASKRKADTVLDSLAAEIPNGIMEGPEGTSVSSLPPAQGDTLARDGSLVAEGHQNGPDRLSPHSRIRDEVEQPVQMVALADDLAPTEPKQDVASDLPRPSEEAALRANQRPGSTQHHPIAHDLQSESREDGKSSSRIAPESTVQRAIRVWSPRLQTASDCVRSASGRVKVWTHERPARRAHESHEAQASANPIYILAAITLGIPALLLIPLIGMNPGVQEGTFTTVVTFLVVSAFVTAVVFEIKRLADQPSDANHH
jgi:hypothetical protein